MAVVHEQLTTRSSAPSRRRRATILTVCGWELRRLLASRTTPALAAALTAVFGLGVLFKHTWTIPIESGGGGSFDIQASTAWGGMYSVVALLLLFFGMVVPFLATDAVARDQKQRTHELLMTSAVRTGAYVGGRFLAALTVALAAAVLLLGAALAANLLLHVADPAYPAPQVAGFLAAWLVAVVPALVLLAGAGFALGTLFPRLSMVVKLGLLLAWVAVDLVVDVGHGAGWFGYWTPSSNGMVKVLVPDLAARYAAAASGLGPAAQRHLALALQQQQPDLWPWVGPHAVLVLAGILAAALAAAAFHRFRNALV